MNLEEIKKKRISFEGKVSVAETDWLIAEVERLTKMTEGMHSHYIACRRTDCSLCYHINKAFEAE